MTDSGSERRGRLNWEDTWFEVAAVIAQRSLCVRDQVGAVIVDANNRIVATGYNGPPTGFQHMEQRCTDWCPRAQTTSEIAKLGRPLMPHHLDSLYNDCPSNHAEANALAVCDRSVRVGGTIYVTSHCCMSCAKLIANSGLKTVSVKPTMLAAHRDPHAVYDFLETCGIDVYVS